MFLQMPVSHQWRFQLCLRDWNWTLAIILFFILIICFVCSSLKRFLTLYKALKGGKNYFSVKITNYEVNLLKFHSVVTLSCWLLSSIPVAPWGNHSHSFKWYCNTVFWGASPRLVPIISDLLSHVLWF